VPVDTLEISMGILRNLTLINILFWMIVFYLGYHLLHGNYNIQNYLITKFETKMFEDFNYKLKNEIIMVNKDIYALGYNYPDMVDEVAKRKYPFPVEGETLIILDRD